MKFEIFIVLLLSVSWQESIAQEASEEKIDEEVVVIGTRSNQVRSATETLVPVDIISEESFKMVGGNADVTDNLNKLVPSFMAAPRNGDNNAFQRSVSLRGMAADQTLIMVNGKRRHRSNAINLFGPIANTGSHSVDTSLIPTMAISNVQVLRDGASAQYGADAIAGVVNFVLKDNPQGGTVEATYGNHFEGESSWRLAGNAGVMLGQKGFLNITFESDDQEALSRGVQRPEAQELLDVDVSVSDLIGADTPFGDAPLVQTWGRPESSAHKFVWNAGYELGDMDLYLFGNYAMKKGKTRFFYRPIGHEWSPTWPGFDRNQNGDKDDPGEKHPEAFENAPNLEDVKRVGFTPYYGSEQTDLSVVAGLQGGLMNNRINYDFSLAMGSNKSEYTLYNSLNPSADLNMGEDAQRDFETGDYEQNEMGINLDMTQEINTTMFLAYGLEYRNETFVQSEGEEASWVGLGSSGLKGTGPDSAGEYSRASYGAYVDMEHDFNEYAILQYTLRFENYDDFGATINYKLAGRYELMEPLSLRGSVSSGFHAPTPGQANLTTVSTTFVDGLQEDTLHIPAASEEAKALGGAELEEETSLNMAVGLVYKWGKNVTLTADYYSVAVGNKIFKTQVTNGEGDKRSFYTNALDVTHSGFDLVLMGNLMDHIGLDMDMSLAFNMNSMEVTENRKINGNQVVSDEIVEHIENDYPAMSFVLMTNTRFMEKWNMMARARYVGNHYDQGGLKPLDESKEIDPTFYLDLELGHRPMKNLQVALGANNVLDSYPTKLDERDGGGYSAGLVYPRRSAANWDGGSWYIRGTYTF